MQKLRQIYFSTPYSTCLELLKKTQKLHYVLNCFPHCFNPMLFLPCLLASKGRIQFKGRIEATCSQELVVRRTSHQDMPHSVILRTQRENDHCVPAMLQKYYSARVEYYQSTFAPGFVDNELIETVLLKFQNQENR